MALFKCRISIYKENNCEIFRNYGKPLAQMIMENPKKGHFDNNSIILFLNSERFIDF